MLLLERSCIQEVLVIVSFTELFPIRVLKVKDWLKPEAAAKPLYISCRQVYTTATHLYKYLPT